LTAKEKIKNNFMSRKYQLSIMCLITFTILLCTGFLTDSVYAALMGGTVGAYMAGNIGEHWTNRNNYGMYNNNSSIHPNYNNNNNINNNNVSTYRVPEGD